MVELLGERHVGGLGAEAVGQEGAQLGEDVAGLVGVVLDVARRRGQHVVHEVDRDRGRGIGRACVGGHCAPQPTGRVGARWPAPPAPPSGARPAVRRAGRASIGSPTPTGAASTLVRRRPSPATGVRMPDTTTTNGAPDAPEARLFALAQTRWPSSASTARCAGQPGALSSSGAPPRRSSGARCSTSSTPRTRTRSGRASPSSRGPRARALPLPRRAPRRQLALGRDPDRARRRARAAATPSGATSRAARRPTRAPHRRLHGAPLGMAIMDAEGRIERGNTRSGGSSASRPAELAGLRLPESSWAPTRAPGTPERVAGATGRRRARDRLRRPDGAGGRAHQRDARARTAATSRSTTSARSSTSRARAPRPRGSAQRGQARRGPADRAPRQLGVGDRDRPRRRGRTSSTASTACGPTASRARTARTSTASTPTTARASPA